jgi:hypothetical protein
MTDKGENHLPIPPAGYPCPDESLIPNAPPKTSMAQINTFVFSNHTTHHYACLKHTQVHVPLFHILQSHKAII